jgi:hypothetical protein
MRATGGHADYAILADSKVIEMDDDVFLYEPDKAPLTLLTSKVSKKAVSNPIFNWLEDERIPTLDRVNQAAGATSVATTFTVDNGDYFRAPGLLKVQRTGEVMYVTAVDGANTVTVVRGWGSSAKAALVDNDQLTILGANQGEGSTSPNSKTTKKVKKTNATEIIRSAWELTNSEIATELYGPQDVAFQQMKVGIEHAVDIENKLWFGEYKEDVAGAAGNSVSTRTTGGFDEVISTNDSDFGGVFNMVTFFSFAEDVFRYGSNSKVLFAAPSVVSNISLEGIKYLELVSKDQTFGLDINRLLTPHGSLMVVKHNLFEGDTYGKRAYVVDLDNVGYRFLRGRDTKLMTNIQANDKDSRKDEYLTEMGFVRRLEKTHGRIKNAA